MKVAIYGAGNYGKYIYNEITNNINTKISVVFWIDNFQRKETNFWLEQEICDLPVYTEERFFIEHKYKEIDAVIVAIDNRNIAEEITTSLLLQGYESIYLALPNGFLPKFPILNEEGDFGSCIKYYKEIKPVIGERGEIVNFLVTDYCNLNCKRCGNFSNLAKGKNCLDINKFESYLVHFRKKFRAVQSIQLMGGEPLLNPQLEQYVLLTRKYFPETRIDIVTNGLLILNISQELINAMVSCNVFFFISQYLPTRKQLEKIVDFLENKQINYIITEPITQFEKPLTLKEENGKKAYMARFHGDCLCNTIEEGRMGCPVILTFYKHRDYFDIHIGEDELRSSTIDMMSDDIDGWDIKKYCKKPNPLCKYCNPKIENVVWETGEPQKEDWFSV